MGHKRAAVDREELVGEGRQARFVWMWLQYKLIHNESESMITSMQDQPPPLESWLDQPETGPPAAPELRVLEAERVREISGTIEHNLSWMQYKPDGS